MSTGGAGYHASCVHTHLHFFLCFCHIVSCGFICRKLTWPSIQKGCFFQKWLFFSNKMNFCRNEISIFFTLSCFSEPYLAKRVLILIKYNLRYSQNFNVTLYLETILFSVVRRLIWEVILHRYLQTLFYIIAIVVVTAPWCYCCSSFLTKTQNFNFS